MGEIMGFAPAGSAIPLCRIFRETVLCVHQLTQASTGSRISYERGRPMPLFRGATSKITLAYLQIRDLRRLYAAHLRRSTAEMRKAGRVVAHAEVDLGVIGIAVLILDDQSRILGSLSYVIPASEERAIARLVPPFLRR